MLGLKFILHMILKFFKSSTEFYKILDFFTQNCYNFIIGCVCDILFKKFLNKISLNYIPLYLFISIISDVILIIEIKLPYSDFYSQSIFIAVYEFKL